MTAFEQYLTKKGYKKYIFNCKTMQREPTDKHVISTMANLDHRYIKNNDITSEICFGLHEANKPPTLINPRPIIRVKRKKDNVIIIEDERYDDSMNLVLNKEPIDKIYKSLFDKSIIFTYDLT